MSIPSHQHYTLFETFDRIGKHLYKDDWRGSEAQWVPDHPDFDNGLVNDWMDYRAQHPDMDEALNNSGINLVMREKYPSFDRFQSAKELLITKLWDGSIPVVSIAPNGDSSIPIPNRLWLDQTGEFEVNLWASTVRRKIDGNIENWRIQIPKNTFDQFLSNLRQLVPTKGKGRPDRLDWQWLSGRLKEMSTSGQIVSGNTKAAICQQLALEHDKKFSPVVPTDWKYIRKRMKDQLDKVINAE